MLHVTNGDSVVSTLAQSSIGGVYLPWFDVLHDGPVPAGVPDEELWRIRSRFFESLGWASYAEALHRFNERHLAILNAPLHDEVVLWFEHDLYDQLQLLQILAWFREHPPGPTRLSLINIGEFPGVTPFHGLGQLDSSQLESLFPSRVPVHADQVDLGHEVWTAFRSSTPAQLSALMQTNLSDLPFLATALRRWFEEFPSIENGLSRSFRFLLEAAADGNQTRSEIYVATRAREPLVFLADASAYWRIDSLATARPNPALAVDSGRYTITDFGQALLDNRADWLRDRDSYEFWMGGIRFVKGGHAWRWDQRTGRLAVSY